MSPPTTALSREDYDDDDECDRDQLIEMAEEEVDDDQEAPEEAMQPPSHPMTPDMSGSLINLRECDNWLRPKFMGLNEQEDPLLMMLVDASMGTVVDESGKALIYMYGLTKEGHSVLVKVHNFCHFFYIPVTDEQISGDDLRRALLKWMNSEKISVGKPGIVDVEICKKMSIMYYIPSGHDIDYYKITLLHPNLMKKVADMLRKGGLQVTKTNGDTVQLPPLFTFDATLDYLLRFMIDVKLVGCSWLTLPPRKYQITPQKNKKTLVQLEVDVDATDIIAHKPEGEWLSTAPLRRLSLDIECAARKGVFPNAEVDSVIQIANYLWEHGHTKPSAKVIFTLKSCAEIVGVDVRSFETEEEMLSAWSRFVRISDPDLLTGYNIVNFDLPYLLDRAKTLKVTEFSCLGRLIGRETRMRNTMLSSSAFGRHSSKSFSMHGRVIFDMLQLITREYKLRSYSLNSVSAEFLGQQKEDVHYSIITDLHNGDEQTRRRLAVYCLKDAKLPIMLMDKLMSLTNYMEMARVTGIPLGWVVSRGHMVKVVSLLHRKSHLVDLLIPDIERSTKSEGEEDGPRFVGATVIDPDTGFYEDPIATLDFASLYPSIIMAHNLCYSTLIRPQQLSLMKPEEYSETPTGDCFVRKHVKKGILTEILEELLAARKKAKKDLKAEEDPFMRSVLNGRQLALKISANAVYGFTGASVGKLPCLQISASTTAYGRDMIHTTRAEVLKRYKGAKVIYGDTDSVMIKFGTGKSLAECMRLGEEAAEAISEIFPNPVALEFEKCYYPYLLVTKKRYAGLLWTNPDNYDKMDTKGIESVRRDNCRLVAIVITSALELLLKKRDRHQAITMVKKVVSDLLRNKIDVSLLVVSKTLTKTHYAGNQAHAVLAKTLQERDPGTAPSLGDRVPYVIMAGLKNEPLYKRAEDPLYVLNNNLAIDNKYYLENMLRKPLERIFAPVMKDMNIPVKTLFEGKHTRSLTIVTPTTGSMMKYTKAQPRCFGCKAVIDEGALCKHCKPAAAKHYTKSLDDMRRLERAYSSLWTECQRCMGDICQDVLCSNGDCPIFYRRRKAQKDLNVAAEKLSRFDLEW